MVLENAGASEGLQLVLAAADIYYIPGPHTRLRTAGPVIPRFRMAAGGHERFPTDGKGCGIGCGGIVGVVKRGGFATSWREVGSPGHCQATHYISRLVFFSQDIFLMYY